MRKWELLDRERAFKSTAPWVGPRVQLGGEEHMSGGDFLFIPCHNREAVGSRLLFYRTRIHTIFTGVFSMWMWIISTQLRNYAACETDLTGAAERSIKKGELNFETAQTMKTASIYLSHIRLCLPLDGAHQFDLIKDGVIDCMPPKQWPRSSVSASNELTLQLLTDKNTKPSSSKCGDWEITSERENIVSERMSLEKGCVRLLQQLWRTSRVWAACRLKQRAVRRWNKTIMSSLHAR